MHYLSAAYSPLEKVIWSRGCKPDYVTAASQRRLTAISLHARACARAGPPMPLALARLRPGRCGIPATNGRAAQSPILPCTGRGLPCRRHHWRRGGLLPHLFTLTPRLPAWRFVFCGTFRQRALTRAAWTWPRLRRPRPASCPAVSGLSSPTRFSAKRLAFTKRHGMRKNVGATIHPGTKRAPCAAPAPTSTPNFG